MSIVPQGSKAVTFDPHEPTWAGGTAQQDSARRRNFAGLLIQKGKKRSNTQLVVLNANDDAGEHTASRTIRHMIAELLSGSALSARLLRRFAFLFLPFQTMQGVRDGFSRFPYDCPYPGYDAQSQPFGGSSNVNANGMSEVGEAIIWQAIYNWANDPADPHANPSASMFCYGSFHNDVLNRLLTNNQGGNPATPTAPYALLNFPGHTGDIDGGAAVFRNADDGGFDAVSWPEFFTGNLNIDKGGEWVGDYSEFGATSFYFELPWRAQGHKASYFFEDEGLQNFAQAFLAGLATVATGWNFDGDALPVTGVGTIAVPAGRKAARGYAPNISATSNIAVAPGRKAVRSTSTLTGVGTLAFTGVHAGSGTAALSSVASATSTGSKADSGAGADISGVASMTAIGLASEQGAGSAALVAIGSTSVSGTAARTGSAASVSGVLAPAFTGYRGVSTVLQGAAAPVSGAASATASGQRGHAKVSTLSGVGSATGTGTKDVSGAAATVTGAGRCIARGPALATTGGFYFSRYVIRRSR